MKRKFVGIKEKSTKKENTGNQTGRTSQKQQNAITIKLVRANEKELKNWFLNYEDRRERKKNNYFKISFFSFLSILFETFSDSSCNASRTTKVGILENLRRFSTNILDIDMHTRFHNGMHKQTQI